MLMVLVASGEKPSQKSQLQPQPYCLRARFQLSDGPGSQGTIAAQFNCEGTTLSGVEFELLGIGYRVSLVKRRFVSGNTTAFIPHHGLHQINLFRQLC